MENIIKLNSFELKIGYCFNNKSLIKNALTHPSISSQKNSISYQRLEFLGDSILSFAVAIYLIESHPNIDEGELTIKRSNIVNKKSLAKCAKAINLDKYILVGESINKITEKMLCDTYEALIGAIMLDSNIKTATTFIKNTLLNNIKSYKTKTNYKGELIEFCIKNEFSIPDYTTKKNKESFISKVTLSNTQQTYQERGTTKKEAENNLSKEILSILKKTIC